MTPPNIEHLEHEWSDLDITHSEASKLEKLTRNQSEDQKWYEERKKRITASNFGIVMKRKKDVNTTFLKNTFRKNKFPLLRHLMEKQMKMSQSKYT